VAALYQELMGSSFSKLGDVASAVAPLAGRFETLKSLRSQTNPQTLMEVVRKSQYPSMVLDAWQRLHSADVAWPLTVEQLDFDREHRKTLSAAVGSRISSDHVAELVKARQESLGAELQQQGPRTWRRFMVAARSAGEIEAALRRGLDADLMNDFGIADLAKVEPPLPAQLQFDIFLYRNRPEVLALAEKLDDKKAQEKVKRLLASLPTGDGADAVAGKIRAGLMELTKDQGGGGGAVVDAGPMSPQVQKVIRWERNPKGTPEQPGFSWNGHDLTFIRLEGAVDANGKKLAPYYLCTTEMTFGLFRDVMDTMGLKATDLNLPKGDRNMSGPQLWDRTGEALKLRENWMRI
jgi:hypothetical protein